MYEFSVITRYSLPHTDPDYIKPVIENCVKFSIDRLSDFMNFYT